MRPIDDFGRATQKIFFCGACRYPNGSHDKNPSRFRIQIKKSLFLRKARQAGTLYWNHNQYNVFFMLSQRFLRYPSVDSQPEFGMALRNLHGFCRQKSDDRISSWFFLKSCLSCYRKGCTAFCDRTAASIFRDFTGTVKRVIDCSPT